MPRKAFVSDLKELSMRIKTLMMIPATLLVAGLPQVASAAPPVGNFVPATVAETLTPVENVHYYGGYGRGYYGGYGRGYYGGYGRGYYGGYGRGYYGHGYHGRGYYGRGYYGRGYY
jgi:hypothetical protein